ncbi:MAG: Glu-tRNA(Gln) amidotransferase subunit GatE [Candidatus Micrarchaeia archaeon]
MLVGLEIHQRLEGKKLFNRCPTPAADQPLDANATKFMRRLNTSAGELGKQDEASEFESMRKRYFEYVAPQKFSCLVDMDEEPPGPINNVALIAALKFSKHINAQIIDEIHMMRKTVVDGSNTSGFQRTALISLGGVLNAGEMQIPISTVCLEEESCGIVSNNGDAARYRLDRLGIPLIEVSTEPVFTSVEQTLHGAQAIGMSLRMLGNVMRGLGTIRQDVNISTPQGSRVEIKGLQDLSLLKPLIENEEKRQEGLIQISAELQKRRKAVGISAPEKISYVDLSPMLANSQCQIIKKALSSGGAVLGAKLEMYAGLLGKELYANRRFGTELSDYAKVSGGVKGMLHSDEDLAKYGLTLEEIKIIRKTLGVHEPDAFILIADERQSASRAIEGALSRAYVLGVPLETRRADEKGGSSFMRPIAGAHRMYPETDVRPILANKELLAKVGKLESFDEKKKELCNLLGDDLGARMAKSYNLATFQKLVDAGADPKLAALTLEQTLVALRREGANVNSITDEFLLELFSLYSKEKITKAAFSQILSFACKNSDDSAQKICEEQNLYKISGKALLDLWKKEGTDTKSFMAKFRFIVDASELFGLLNIKK